MAMEGDFCCVNECPRPNIYIGSIVHAGNTDAIQFTLDTQIVQSYGLLPFRWGNVTSSHNLPLSFRFEYEVALTNNLA